MLTFLFRAHLVTGRDTKDFWQILDSSQRYLFSEVRVHIGYRYREMASDSPGNSLRDVGALQHSRMVVTQTMERQWYIFFCALSNIRMASWRTWSRYLRFF